MIMSRKPTKPAATEAPVKVTFSVPKPLLEALDAYAQAEDRSRSNAAVRLLERALADARRAG